MAVVLDAGFYERPALEVARDLLGRHLVRRMGRRQISAVIHETEAYVGPHDLACHAAKGCTPRTEVMFGPAGHWYVYFIYGVHWMLNVVTDQPGFAAAVLIRGVGQWDGPGKLTKAMHIDKSLNGSFAQRKSGLWIEDRGILTPRSKIVTTPRIGVAYSGPWAAKPYRFVLTSAVPKRKAARL